MVITHFPINPKLDHLYLMYYCQKNFNYRQQKTWLPSQVAVIQPMLGPICTTIIPITVSLNFIIESLSKQKIIIKPLPKWSFYLPHPSICLKHSNSTFLSKLFRLSLSPIWRLIFKFYEITYRGKKNIFFKYSRVIHQKKRLLSLIIMQKSVLQNSVKMSEIWLKNHPNMAKWLKVIFFRVFGPITPRFCNILQN